LGTETVGGIAASKLELIPKSDRFRNNIARIWLWIDPARGISVQQQFFQPDGDYRLAKVFRHSDQSETSGERL
jgi:hypothetical protein